MTLYKGFILRMCDRVAWIENHCKKNRAMPVKSLNVTCKHTENGIRILPHERFRTQYRDHQE